MKKKSVNKKLAGTSKTSPLEFALDLELKGVNMYLKLATETSNPLGKKLFYSLAGEEIEHAKKVDEIYHKLSGYNNLQLTSKNLPSVANELKGFFLKSRSRDLEKGSENVSGYKIAMRMEKESIFVYNRFMETARTDLEKGFYRQIIKEEKVHLEAVLNVYSFLTKTDDWLQEEESKTWNWMNM